MGLVHLRKLYYPRESREARGLTSWKKRKEKEKNKSQKKKPPEEGTRAKKKFLLVHFGARKCQMPMPNANA
jgi:hypothetical protein